MRYALLVLVFSASTASAQTVEATLDMSALGWGPLALPQSIETDGDLNTFEWLLKRATWTVMLPEVRIVAERDGGTCSGPWFTLPSAAWSVQRRGLIHIIVAQDAQDVKIIRLDTPVCDH